GQALVADFGIARAVTVAGASGLTATGFSVGTPHYMSPEQAAGDRPVDARSDVYSLGATTYEMLTGERPHSATSAQTIVRKILTRSPSPIPQARDLVPANVDAAVQRALAKSPADRFARASQFADALVNPAFRLPVTSDAVTAAGSLPSPRRSWSWGLMVATLAIGLAAGWALRTVSTVRRQSRSDLRTSIFYLPLDSGDAIPGYPALSPDGSTLVYPVGDAGSNRLYQRRLENPTPTPVPGTAGAASAFFSADGEWVGFLADQSLKKVR